MSISEKTKEDYKKLLETFCNKKSRDPIPNRCPWQARLAILTLLESAYEKQKAKAVADDDVTVRILTSTLPEYIYGGEAADLVEKFRDRGGRLKLVVWNTDCPDIFSSKQMKSLYGDPSSYRLSGTKELSGDINHILLVDDDAYRLEAPHQSHEGTEFTETEPQIPARICFRDKEQGEELVKFFDQVWNFSRPTEQPVEAS